MAKTKKAYVHIRCVNGDEFVGEKDDIEDWSDTYLLRGAWFVVPCDSKDGPRWTMRQPLGELYLKSRNILYVRSIAPVVFDTRDDCVCLEHGGDRG